MTALVLLLLPWAFAAGGDGATERMCDCAPLSA